jgi:putative Mg2+ transporter-C (MgtC) family protein
VGDDHYRRRADGRVYATDHLPVARELTFLLSSAVFAERIVVALLLGVAIGVDRQWRQRMAGLRTNTLVAVGAALFASISILMNARINPTQVAAYVVFGIGFLAGAVIFKERVSVLTEAAIGAVAIIGANVSLRPIVQPINRQPLDQTELSQAYEIAVVSPGSSEEMVRAPMLSQIRGATLVLRSLESHDVDAARTDHGDGRDD